MEVREWEFASTNTTALYDAYRKITDWTPVQFFHWAVQNADKIDTGLHHSWVNAFDEAEFQHNWAKQQQKIHRNCHHVVHFGEKESGTGDMVVLCPPEHPDWYRHHRLVGDVLPGGWERTGVQSRLHPLYGHLPL